MGFNVVKLDFIVVENNLFIKKTGVGVVTREVGSRERMCGEVMLDGCGGAGDYAFSVCVYGNVV